MATTTINYNTQQQLQNALAQQQQLLQAQYQRHQQAYSVAQILMELPNMTTDQLTAIHDQLKPLLKERLIKQLAEIEE